VNCLSMETIWKIGFGGMGGERVENYDILYCIGLDWIGLD